MRCMGCGNEDARITRTYALADGLAEVCDAKECGDLRAPWVPDVFFPGPHFSEHLGGEDNPNGVFVESRRHKARLLAAQGLREDGDRVHGSIFKDARKPQRGVTEGFKKKLDASLRNTLKRFRK